uniref:Uncharacterized protein n=1 Tax=Rhizophora mucronata TaxID=61149 RepID=A0A2P2IL74_RHIMU
MYMFCRLHTLISSLVRAFWKNLIAYTFQIFHLMNFFLEVCLLLTCIFCVHC